MPPDQESWIGWQVIREDGVATVKLCAQARLAAATAVREMAVVEKCIVDTEDLLRKSEDGGKKRGK